MECAIFISYIRNIKIYKEINRRYAVSTITPPCVSMLSILYYIIVRGLAFLREPLTAVTGSLRNTTHTASGRSSYLV